MLFVVCEEEGVDTQVEETDLILLKARGQGWYIVEPTLQSNHVRVAKGHRSQFLVIARACIPL